MVAAGIYIGSCKDTRVLIVEHNMSASTSSSNLIVVVCNYNILNIVDDSYLLHFNLAPCSDSVIAHHLILIIYAYTGTWYNKKQRNKEQIYISSLLEAAAKIPFVLPTTNNVSGCT